MNVATITMEPKAAQAKLDAWRKRLGRNPDPVAQVEYQGALEGYKALARGTPIIELASSIVAAGRHARDLRPVLAVCRADARRCELRMFGSNRVRFTHGTLLSRGRQGWGRDFEFTIPGGPVDNNWHSATAIVPMIPPDVGPARINLKKHAILWEAVWTPTPPVDPMLLRPLAGNLYAVIAAWDLTPIEQAVIAGRLRT